MDRGLLARVGFKFKEIYGVNQTDCPDLFGAFLAGYIQHEADLRNGSPTGYRETGGHRVTGDELKRKMAEAGIGEYKHE